MGSFIARRALLLVPFLFLVSIVSFMVIQLPPGDFITTYVANLQAQGGTVNDAQIESLRNRYGMDQPLIGQYFTWVKNIVLHGDFGNSFQYDRPVAEILVERVPRTMAISLASILLTWMIAVPLGIIAAIKQYSVWDYLIMFVSFIGLSIPSFLLALVVMYVVFDRTGFIVTGLYSPEFRGEEFSFAKMLDLMKNVWMPLIVLAVTSAAGTIRVLRATLLDELQKPYVTTARAKGLKERDVILRYPIRIAINPLISTIGWALPAIVGGEVIVSKVLNLPTVGPVLLDATMAQDMYLAGGLVLILSALTVVGTLISDILLAMIDPRIRYD